MDILDQAEELNQVSALYNVEIDGVPLQQLSTNELSKVSERRGSVWEKGKSRSPSSFPRWAEGGQRECTSHE